MEDHIAVSHMKRDIAKAAATLTDDEARFLVDAYYMMQEDRKRAHNQVRSLGESAEPNSVLAWLADQSETLESQIKRALDKYTAAHVMGGWMRGIYGIGPVLSAGLLAHIDMEPWRCYRQDVKKKKCKPGEPCTAMCKFERTQTAGAIWAFAGLDPNRKWEKGEIRPWNATLKTLCWKIGQSFMKFSNEDECFYGILYRQRKAYEIERNEAGGNAEAAALGMKRVGPSTEAYQHYKTGKLPPAQIDARARRYAVKIFLSHLHGAWYETKFKEKPPLPYAIAILGHAHLISRPH
jgi:hypothetical protein